jgi:hypothetical protein
LLPFRSQKENSHSHTKKATKKQQQKSSHFLERTANKMVIQEFAWLSI